MIKNLKSLKTYLPLILLVVIVITLIVAGIRRRETQENFLGGLFKKSFNRGVSRKSGYTRASSNRDALQRSNKRWNNRYTRQHNPKEFNPKRVRYTIKNVEWFKAKIPPSDIYSEWANGSDIARFNKAGGIATEHKASLKQHALIVEALKKPELFKLEFNYGWNKQDGLGTKYEQDKDLYNSSQNKNDIQFSDNDGLIKMLKMYVKDPNYNKLTRDNINFNFPGNRMIKGKTLYPS